jgi:hypothetical protein
MLTSLAGTSEISVFSEDSAGASGVFLHPESREKSIKSANNSASFDFIKTPLFYQKIEFCGTPPRPHYTIKKRGCQESENKFSLLDKSPFWNLDILLLIKEKKHKR